MTKTYAGELATLADVAARIVNEFSEAGTDSCGYEMVKLRASLVLDLQNVLANSQPDPRDHNTTLSNALARRV
jgi:hypothetical protein